jgi:hypothetical protein
LSVTAKKGLLKEFAGIKEKLPEDELSIETCKSFF